MKPYLLGIYVQLPPHRLTRFSNFGPFVNRSFGIFFWFCYRFWLIGNSRFDEWQGIARQDCNESILHNYHTKVSYRDYLSTVLSKIVLNNYAVLHITIKRKFSYLFGRYSVCQKWLAPFVQLLWKSYTVIFRRCLRWPST